MSLGAFSANAAQILEPVDLIRSVSSAVSQRMFATPASQTLSTADVIIIVDTLVLPNVDAPRMTASALGRYWRRATPAQKSRLQDEFLRLVIHTYSGALSQLKNQKIIVMPTRMTTSAEQVVIRTEVHGDGQPLRIDYRLIKTSKGWKIYDFSVMGVWLIMNYRTSFARVISTKGIDGLISTLVKKNHSNQN